MMRTDLQEACEATIARLASWGADLSNGGSNAGRRHSLVVP
jgi:hypothetical protein